MMIDIYRCNLQHSPIVTLCNAICAGDLGYRGGKKQIYLFILPVIKYAANVDVFRWVIPQASFIVVLLNCLCAVFI